MTNDSETASQVGVGQLLSGIIADAQDLIKQQLALFRYEIQGDMRRLREGFFLVAGGSAILLVGCVLLCLLLVYLLSWAVPSLPLWACYGIVGVPVVLIGGGLLRSGARKLKALDRPLEQSVQALKDNIEEPAKALTENNHG